MVGAASNSPRPAGGPRPRRGDALLDELGIGAREAAPVGVLGQRRCRPPGAAQPLPPLRHRQVGIPVGGEPLVELGEQLVVGVDHVGRGHGRSPSGHNSFEPREPSGRLEVDGTIAALVVLGTASLLNGPYGRRSHPWRPPAARHPTLVGHDHRDSLGRPEVLGLLPARLGHQPEQGSEHAAGKKVSTAATANRFPTSATTPNVTRPRPRRGRRRPPTTRRPMHGLWSGTARRAATDRGARTEPERTPRT